MTKRQAFKAARKLYPHLQSRVGISSAAKMLQQKSANKKSMSYIDKLGSWIEKAQSLKYNWSSEKFDGGRKRVFNIRRIGKRADSRIRVFQDKTSPGSRRYWAPSPTNADDGHTFRSNVVISKPSKSKRGGHIMRVRTGAEAGGFRPAKRVSGSTMRSRVRVSLFGK